jgi:hypothetical protein
VHGARARPGRWPSSSPPSRRVSIRRQAIASCQAEDDHEDRAVGVVPGDAPAAPAEDADGGREAWGGAPRSGRQNGTSRSPKAAQPTSPAGGEVVVAGAGQGSRAPAPGGGRMAGRSEGRSSPWPVISANGAPRRGHRPAGGATAATSSAARVWQSRNSWQGRGRRRVEARGRLRWDARARSRPPNGADCSSSHRPHRTVADAWLADGQIETDPMRLAGGRG